MINFDKLTPKKTKFGTFYDARFLKELDQLNEDDALTIEECAKILSITTNRVRQLIKESGRRYREGKWHIDLNTLLIQKGKCKTLKKSDLAEFFKYLEHKQILKELRENKIAYRKAMNAKYGTITYTTKCCKEANFDCSICLNKNACSIANNKPFVKRITAILQILNNNNYEPNIMNRFAELEEENKKLKIKNADLKIKIFDLQKTLLNVKKELLESEQE